VTYFEVSSHHLPGGAEENLDKYESSRTPGRILNPKSLKYYPRDRKIRTVIFNFHLSLLHFSEWGKYRPYTMRSESSCALRLQ
jgi:hypothetical protein